MKVIDSFFISIDSFFEKAEKRFGIAIVIILTGLFFLFLSALITSIRLDLFFHGNGFTRLSTNPFDLESENDLRYRILSPLLGYILYLRGVAFKYFMLFVLAIFFGLIYFFLRKDKVRPSEALGITALCSFSTLSFHQLYFPAYTDPTSYLLILLFINLYRNYFVGIMLISLMLFNHENTVFLFPFFFLLMMEKDFSFKKIIKVAMQFIIAIVPYLIFRKFISMNSHVGFTITYYFDHNNLQWTKDHVLPHLADGIYQSFRLFWLIPVIAIIINFYEKNYYELLLLVVIFLGVTTQFVIAYDISRLAGLAFPMILISALRMRAFMGTEKFLRVIYILILINFFIPSWYVGALEPVRLKPWWM
jgi:hypothetical protein